MNSISKKLIFSLSIVLMLTMLTSGVFGFNIFKWQLCDSGNVTGGNCDDYWDEFKSQMGITEPTNVTSVNLTEVHENFYNKTRIDEMFANFTQNISNFTNVELDNATIRAGVSDFMRDRDLPIDETSFNRMVDDRIGVSDNGSSSGSSGDILEYALFGIAALVGLWFFLGRKGGREQKPDVQPAMNTIRRRPKYDEPQQPQYPQQVQPLPPQQLQQVQQPIQQQPPQEPKQKTSKDYDKEIKELEDKVKELKK